MKNLWADHTSQISQADDTLSDARLRLHPVATASLLPSFDVTDRQEEAKSVEREATQDSVTRQTVATLEDPLGLPLALEGDAGALVGLRGREEDDTGGLGRTFIGCGNLAAAAELSYGSILNPGCGGKVGALGTVEANIEARVGQMPALWTSMSQASPDSTPASGSPSVSLCKHGRT
ncbi:MAG: hypothetical protein FRX49_06551 [Trebouxia sp. A1-2]|nr:MAG: hypothetical protein FRX49_06551 [Trebouxia sp. A1-2]